jgi:hypothetical protein
MPDFARRAVSSGTTTPLATVKESSPDNDAWLAALIERSALLPEPGLRRHWRRVLPWLSTAARYELAAILLDSEHAVQCD